MQLIAYGAQDIFLTGNPQITFFKIVYRRHTNFSMEYVPQNFESTPTFETTSSTKVKYKIKRVADLLYDIYIVYDLPEIYCAQETDDSGILKNEKFQWINNLGQNIIESAEIFVAGQSLDKQYSTWMNIWNELTLTDTDKQKYNYMIGNREGIFQDIPLSHYLGAFSGTATPTINGSRLYIPLNFWFCQNPGLAIPLVSLQYTELELHVTFAPLNELFTLGENKASPHGIFNSLYDPDNLGSLLKTNLGYTEENILWRYINGTKVLGGWNQNTFLLLHYIYLDEPERRRFAKSSVEYLMTQTQRIQRQGLSGLVNDEIKLLHPIKELIFVLRRNDVDRRNAWNNYTDLINTDIPNQTTAEFTDTQQSHDQDLLFQNHTDYFNNLFNILYSGKLRFNGHARFDDRSDIFFNFAQPYKYHQGSGADGVYVYSFALEPDNYQPSGSCNFSRINKVKIELVLKKPPQTTTTTPNYNYAYNYDLDIYAVNYNVFRIMAGIGSLVFAN